jgi:hypothetical protein
LIMHEVRRPDVIGCGCACPVGTQLHLRPALRSLIPQLQARLPV